MQRGAKKVPEKRTKLSVPLSISLDAELEQEARRRSVIENKFVPKYKIVVEWIRERLSGKSKAA